MASERNVFLVELNVSNFCVEDLSVLASGHELIISGKHGEREEDGCIVERQFVRKFILPKNAKDDEMTSEYCADGTLKVTVPLDMSIETRKIPIKVHPNWKLPSAPCYDLIVREPIPLWWW